MSACAISINSLKLSICPNTPPAISSLVQYPYISTSRQSSVPMGATSVPGFTDVRDVERAPLNVAADVHDAAAMKSPTPANLPQVMEVKATTSPDIQLAMLGRPDAFRLTAFQLPQKHDVPPLIPLC